MGCRRRQRHHWYAWRRSLGPAPDDAPSRGVLPPRRSGLGAGSDRRPGAGDRAARLPAVRRGAQRAVSAARPEAVHGAGARRRDRPRLLPRAAIANRPRTVYDARSADRPRVDGSDPRRIKDPMGTSGTTRWGSSIRWGPRGIKRTRAGNMCAPSRRRSNGFAFGRRTRVRARRSPGISGTRTSSWGGITASMVVEEAVTGITAEVGVAVRLVPPEPGERGRETQHRRCAGCTRADKQISLHNASM